MDMMPDRNIYAWFLAYTNDITTSVMHISSNTQMICNQIGTPLIYLPARIEAKYNTKIEFSKKEKLIIISPDLTFCNIEFKRKFIRKLNNELPEYNVAVPYNKKHDDYRCLQAVASAVITFGEGWDAYFIDSGFLGTVGIAVYNDVFFPDKNITKLKNVYKSYDDLYENFVKDFKQMMSDEKLYYDTIKKINSVTKKKYKKDIYMENLKRITEGNYDFYPEKGSKLGEKTLPILQRILK